MVSLVTIVLPLQAHHTVNPDLLTGLEIFLELI